MGKDSFLGKGPISICSFGGGGLRGQTWNLIHVFMLVLRWANPSVFKSRKFGLWRHFAEAMIACENYAFCHHQESHTHTFCLENGKFRPWNHTISTWILRTPLVAQTYSFKLIVTTSKNYSNYTYNILQRPV